MKIEVTSDILVQFQLMAQAKKRLFIKAINYFYRPVLSVLLNNKQKNKERGKMSKYNSGASFPVPSRGVIKTTTTPALTHEGGRGFARTPRSELFLTAVTEMAEDKFYEKAEQRRVRVQGLVATVLSEPGGYEWLAAFLPWLRHTANMRSAPVILLGEMAAAGAQGLRGLVSSTLSRADEPAELLGYWLQFHGRSLPAGLKRGIADSAVRLYTERNALKWDGQSKAIRFGDVIDLTHPIPKDEGQSVLFKQLLDNRHNRDGAPHGSLAFLNLDYSLQRLPVEGRRIALSNAIDAGWSWERLAGWLPGGMDSEAWEAVIPNMGYMALLRNLRNFENAGVSKTVLQSIDAKLADPEEVAKSKQFPYRFLSAYLATESVAFSAALEAALEYSLSNVPVLRGSSLILIDTSGSMQSAMSSRSQVRCSQVAALFGVALSKTAERVDTVLYATDSMEYTINPKASTLRIMEALNRESGKVGYGTNTHGAIRKYLRPDHDRVIILTDEQSHDDGKGSGLNPWVHTINLAGYSTATIAPGSKVFSYGGFTDAMFKLIPLMENGAQGRWPWEG